MDHSSMDHDMPPGHHMPDHDMPHACKANMLFTWEYEDVCVVFSWWHIYDKYSLFLTMLALILITAGYEYLKYQSKLYQCNNLGQFKVVLPNTNYQNMIPKDVKLKNSLFYGAQVGYSFMLMLVFMSFNGWLMISVVLGAILGHYIWGGKFLNEENVGDNESDSLACH